MTGDQSIAVFKVFGKMIQLNNLASSASNDLKTCSVTLAAQQGAQDYTYYDSMSGAVIPLQNAMVQILDSLDNVPANTKQGITSYLQTLTDELSLTGNQTSSQVLDAIEAVLAANSLYVVPSGSFWTYFNTNFSYSFPLTIRDTVIDDAWITTSVV